MKHEQIFLMKNFIKNQINILLSNKQTNKHKLLLTM